MLPLRLTLENFMPYRGRHEPLELEGLGVACLAGENGSGKSSLLDAITWALWGRSRVGASADPLVAAGTAEMAVELEFRVGQGRYRVIRRHRKRGDRGRAGQTTLEFQAWDGASYRSLSGTTARETQQELTKALRLDYDTFINTAFLVQGRADLFTLKPPAERKRLLGEILGLSQYDRLVEGAREEAREREAQRRATQLTGESLDQELTSIPETQEALRVVSTGLLTLRPELDVAVLREKELDAEMVRLGQLKTEQERLERESSERQEEMGRLEARRAVLAEQITATEAVLARRAEIEAEYAALESARSALSVLGEQARSLALLQERRTPLEKVVTEAKSVIEREVASLETKAGSLKSEAGRSASLETELAAAAKRREELDAARAEHTQRSQGLSEIIEKVEVRRARIRSLRDEDKEIQGRVALLEEQTEEGRCPLCGNDLGSHGMGQVREHYKLRRKEIEEEVGTVTVEGQALQKERQALEERIQADETTLRKQMTEADGVLGRLRTESTRAKRAVAEVGDAEKRLMEVRGRMSSRSYAEAEQRTLAEVEKEEIALGYDTEAHNAAGGRVQELERWEAEHRSLENATATLPQNRTAMEEVEDAVGRVQGFLEETSGQLGVLAESLSAWNSTEASLATVRVRISELRQQVETQEREETRLRLRLEDLERRQAERRRLQGQEREFAKEKEVYDDLASAFGVRGVQALLVETALPELEEEANALLARMTDNRMHLRLVTQRQTGSGSQQETLDLVIGDEWGTRVYELYSGGETFRINFALRIALSKLLARRAGAEVPVLFIDEGFGSQDATGRDRLVEAISTLWEDPAFHDGLILVITHMEEVKEQFDARIEVTKTERGAQFRIAS